MHSYIKAFQMSFINIFTCILYQHAQKFVTTFIKIFTIYVIKKNWQLNSTVTTSEWVNCVQPAEVNIFHLYALAKRYIAQYFLDITMLQSWSIFHQKDLTLQMDHHLICYLRMFLQLLIIVSSSLSTTINSSMPSCEPNIG